MLIAETVFDPPEPVDTPYHSVRHALHSAFTREAQDVIAAPAFYRSRLSDSDLSPYDRAAQAAVILSLLHENCRLDVIRAVSALYMPIDVSPRGRLITKLDAIHSLSWHLYGYPHLANYPREYLRDVVCLWADAPTRKTEPEWIKTLGKSARMLRYIKFGNRARGQFGVCQILDGLIDEALAVLEPVFARRGLV
jgi:hypothetical protein